MSEIKFTPRQKNAILAPVADILVSAAAGSGKTAVLTQRIIKNITDKENPVSISDMLIVTFTKAAASELRTRIGKAISEQYAKDPEDRYLRRQLMLVETAHISTIHSFCADIIKSHSAELRLPTKMRVSDENEMKLMRAELIDKVIALEYESRGDIFNEFVENFESVREGRFSSTLLSLYEKLESYTDGLEYIKKSRDMFSEITKHGLKNSVYEEKIIRHVKRVADHFYKECDDAVKYLSSSDIPSYNSQADIFSKDKKIIHRLRSSRRSISGIRSALGGIVFDDLLPVKAADKCDDYNYFVEVRNKYKEVIKGFASDYLSADDHMIRKSAEKSMRFCDELYNILSKFEREMQNEKLDRAMLDFNDLERYTYKLFYNDDGSTSKTANDVAASFKQIYIDEYQDVNPLQDKIFRAIGRRNIFIVGDIKQSIYSFRGSAPELFADYRAKYPEYDSETVQDQMRIFLTENFRCDESVIRFSNRVFECLFNNNSGKVPYLKEDALSYGKKPEEDKHQKVTVALVKYDKETKDSAEADYVASEIEKLISSGVSPCDIAIILRSIKKESEKYKTALEKRGIRYITTAKRDLLAEPEIMLIISCLKCIDDPESDVSLAGTLKSPMFGFSLDDLAQLAFRKENNLYRALKSCAEEDNCLGVKCRRFEEWLKASRIFAASHSSSETVRYLLGECSLEVLIKASSDIPSLARENINSFYTLVCNFESSSFKGLHRFIKYLEEMKERKVVAEGSDGPTDDSNSVRIISVHQSKGLEFGVCFLCSAAKLLNNKDANESLIIDRELGISLRLRDESGLVKYDTVMRKAGSINVTENMIDDEMRVLYVALTRAKNKLYVTASCDDPEKLKKKCARIASARSYYSYLANRNYIYWILSSLDIPEAGEYCEIKVIAQTEEQSLTVTENEAPEMSEKVDIERIKRFIDFRYQWEASRTLPSKMAVSVLYPGALDEYEDRMSSRMTAHPRFEGESDVPGGAKRGTATHLFMQFCDYERIERQGVDREIENLVDLGFITRETASLIYRDKLETFFGSDLYKSIKASGNVMREYRFNVKMPAERFTEDEDYAALIRGEEILVQGVIDCFYETDDGEYVIVDYKTDYVREPEELIQRYSLQLGYYKYAIGKLTGRKVKQTVIFSFFLGREIVLDL